MSEGGKAGVRFEARKSGYRFGCARRGRLRAAQAANFSVKEKDETRLARVCGREPLNTFILALPEFEGFCFLELSNHNERSRSERMPVSNRTSSVVRIL